MKKLLLFIPIFLLSFSIEAKTNVKVVEEAPQVSQTESNQKVLKRKVAIGRFSNETQYAKGIFYDKENDPMGKQALDILSAKLAASNKFLLLERSDLASLLAEAQKNGTDLAASVGADYMIIGSITEYGRKNIGKTTVFTDTKIQIVEAKVSIRLVDVSSGLIIYSDEAAGQAETKSKTTLGLGGEADFDATLSDKAISQAIGQLVNNIITKCTDQPWKTYFLSYDEDGVLIAGGKSQGLTAGTQLVVKTKGKQVKNPQTGITIQLPGKEIATLTVLSSAGNTPETEYSSVQVNGTIDPAKISNYIIEEK